MAEGLAGCKVFLFFFNFVFSYTSPADGSKDF